MASYRDNSLISDQAGEIVCQLVPPGLGNFPSLLHSTCPYRGSLNNIGPQQHGYFLWVVSTTPAGANYVNRRGKGLHEDLRGSSWIVCGTTWIRRPALAIGGASWTLTLSSTSCTRPQLKEAFLNGLFP
jgi:hypothetical protein